jgi:hypothetical protein
MSEDTRVRPEPAKKDRPAYETPRVKVMTEREILNTFQITQAMVTWWAAC